MEQTREALDKLMDDLDELENNIRSVCPNNLDVVPATEDEYCLYTLLNSAKVHVTDLRCDIGAALDISRFLAKNS